MSSHNMIFTEANSMFDWFIYASPGEKIGIILIICFIFGIGANKGGRSGGKGGGSSTPPPQG